MIDSIVTTFGPFLIPVIIFVLGLVGYFILFLLTRRGILGSN
jgi:uncharacterized RDD family membrane protein YckC